MAHASILCFVITVLASQVGHAVSLKFAEDHNAMGASSLARVDESPIFYTGKRIVHTDSALKSLMGHLVSRGQQEKSKKLPNFDPDMVMAEIEGKFNQSIAAVNTTITATLKRFENQLLPCYPAKDRGMTCPTWKKYATMLPLALSSVQASLKPIFTAIQTMTDAGVPDDMPFLSQGLDAMASSFNELAEATLLAQNMSKIENISYDKAKRSVTMINATMYTGLKQAKLGNVALNALFNQIVTEIVTNPILSQLPADLASRLVTIMGMAKNAAKDVQTQCDRMYTFVVSSVDEASVDALSKLKQEQTQIDGTHSDALRVAPLLAAMLAVGAVAFA